MPSSLSCRRLAYRRLRRQLYYLLRPWIGPGTSRQLRCGELFVRRTYICRRFRRSVFRSIPFRRLSAAAKLGAFRRLVRQLKPEVIHSYSFYTNFAAYWAVWGTRAIAVGSVRSDFIWAKKEIGPWLGRLSARWPRHQICNSSSAAEIVRRSGSLLCSQPVLRCSQWP